jgi:hypothetical protein
MVKARLVATKAEVFKKVRIEERWSPYIQWEAEKKNGRHEGDIFDSSIMSESQRGECRIRGNRAGPRWERAKSTVVREQCMR